MSKISADAIRHEEAQADAIKFEAAIESELEKVLDQKQQQDIKIEELMKQIKDLAEKIPDGEKANEEVQELKVLVNSEFSLLKELKDLIELLKQKNIKLIRDGPEPKPKPVNFYEEIKLETEEQNEKFIAKTNEKT